MSKSTAYEELLNEVKSFIQDENDNIACMANVAALIHERFGFWWTGFYRVIGEELVLGPFQGKPACIEIPLGRGVCGTAAQKRETVLVEDVHQFPGHIACDSASNSEIVVPIFKNGAVYGVLDIDSPYFARFTREDQRGLEEIVKILEENLSTY